MLLECSHKTNLLSSLVTWCSQCASLSVESLYLQGRDLSSKAGAFIVIIIVVVVVVVVRLRHLLTVVSLSIIVVVIILLSSLYVVVLDRIYVTGNLTVS